MKHCNTEFFFGFQWRSENQISKYIQWDPILNGPKEVGLQMAQILNGIWDPEAQLFEIQTNGCHFVKKHLKSGQKRQYFKWLGL